jgi:hypothetical protein
MTDHNHGPTWPTSQHDDLPAPGCGCVAKMNNEALRSFLHKVKQASTDPADPMQKFSHELGRESALELYHAHLQKYVDGPALASARAAFLAMHAS